MSVLPFPSFLDDIKEKGVRKAVVDLADQTVERVTAGLTVRDIREVLRGDPPSRRPNPRLTPHADAFWMHMRPSYYHASVTGVYPTFRLGWLATYFFAIEIITGMFLMVFYTPSPLSAYDNMLNILSNVPFGQLMRDIHRLGAEGMVLTVFLHMLRTFITGSYKKPRQFTWATGVILLLTTLLLSFSGYLLPWDQLAFWAVTIGTSMAEAAPPEIVGTNVNLLLRGAPDIGAGGLLRFYLLHVFALPIVTLIFLGVHYYKVVLHGHSLPPGAEDVGTDTAKRVPLTERKYYIPDVLTNELLWVGATTFLLIVLAVWFYHAPLESHADPQVTPLHTTAPWYFLWLQGLLKMGDKVFFGLVIPSVLLVVLLVMPYLDVSKSRRYAHRRFMLTVGMLAAAGFVLLSWMGSPEYAVDTSGDQEIAQELAPMEGVGPVRAIPFDDLVPGMYSTEALGDSDAAAALTALYEAEGRNMRRFTISSVPEDAPGLLAVLEEFNHLIEQYSYELPNAWGMLIVSDAQTDLRRVEIYIEWDTPAVDEEGNQVRDADGNIVVQTDENGEPLRSNSGKAVYVHADSGYYGSGH
ncbi:MAG: cytochrome b N-terminal domain-containing protein [Anaerolineae bacterium]|nr:cytochrome b N-terminal domain-containing protein [Anaerolineae bacterium]